MSKGCSLRQSGVFRGFIWGGLPRQACSRLFKSPAMSPTRKRLRPAPPSSPPLHPLRPGKSHYRWSCNDSAALRFGFRVEGWAEWAVIVCKLCLHRWFMSKRLTTSSCIANVDCEVNASDDISPQSRLTLFLCSGVEGACPKVDPDLHPGRANSVRSPSSSMPQSQLT